MPCTRIPALCINSPIFCRLSPFFVFHFIPSCQEIPSILFCGQKMSRLKKGEKEKNQQSCNEPDNFPARLFNPVYKYVDTHTKYILHTLTFMEKNGSRPVNMKERKRRNACIKQKYSFLLLQHWAEKKMAFVWWMDGWSTSVPNSYDPYLLLLAAARAFYFVRIPQLHS